MKISGGAWARQLRLHQWVKNLLLAVPAFAAFSPLTSLQVSTLVWAFLSFGLTASAVYIFNDLVDLDDDRSHPQKRERPLAAGKISIPLARVVALLAVLAGFGFASLVNLNFVAVLAIYLVLTTAYSFWLKQAVIVDAIVLAALYTLRVLAGGVAIGVTVSFWLTTFSIFLFISLAWVKRYAELLMWKSRELSPVGRGYRSTDLPLVMTFGVAAAFVAVLVFALYLDSSNILTAYALPAAAWLAIPFLAYLVGRIWLKTVRGEMNLDPILFVLRDAASLVTLALIAASLVIAHLGVAW